MFARIKFLAPPLAPVIIKLWLFKSDISRPAFFILRLNAPRSAAVLKLQNIKLQFVNLFVLSIKDPFCFSGRNIAPVYINIYSYISKVNSPDKIFFQARTTAAGPAASGHSIAGFSANTCAAACDRGPGSHALPNIAKPEAFRAPKLAPFGTLPSMGNWRGA